MEDRWPYATKDSVNGIDKVPVWDAVNQQTVSVSVSNLIGALENIIVEGAQGPQGEPGEPGEQGPQGEPGEAGTVTALADIPDVVITTPSNGQVLKFDGTNWVNGTDETGEGGGGVGTVTSVAMSVPTGLSIAGSPITTSGTFAVSYTSGYSIPTDANQANWTTAFGWGNHASAGYLTSIADASVTNAKLATAAPLTVKGRADNSTGVVTDMAASEDGQVMRRLGTSLGFGRVTTLGIDDASVTDAKISNRAALSVFGRSANSIGVGADMAAATDGHVMRRSGTTLGFGTLTGASLADAIVTNAKLANMNANTVKARAASTAGVPSDVGVGASQLVGRGSTGDIAAITLGSGLAMTGTTLSSTGGTGAVDSVNGETGVVVLDAADVGALSATDATEITATKTTPIGADTIVLFDSADSGLPKLATLTSLPGGGDMANPMTTAGDIIIGGSSGTPARLAAGTNTQVLTVVSGAPAWAAAPSLTPGDPVTVSHDGAGADPELGDTLSADFATGWFGSVQWQRDSVNISGATSATYTVVEADEATYVAPVVSSLGFTATGFNVTTTATAPAAFDTGDWNIGDATTINITGLPSDGGMSITALQYDINASGTPIALSGTTIDAYTISALTPEDDVRVRAVNAVDPGPWSSPKTYSIPGGTAEFVQRDRVFTAWSDEVPITLPVAATAGNAVFVVVITANALGAPTSVVGSDAVSFGSPFYTYAGADQTHRYYGLANAAAITGATVTLPAENSSDVLIYEVSGLGSSFALDDSDGATYGSSVSPWEFAITPTVTGTFMIANMNLTLDAWPVGVSPVVAGPASSDYSQWAYAEIAASGLQTLEVNMTTDGTTPTTRAGDRSWIVIRAGS